ncbi:MAG: hypothetical protein IPH35_17350 [Rhodoferax sp.]|nr:hypothetical protein [Rhodoferax sp.]
MLYKFFSQFKLFFIVKSSVQAVELDRVFVMHPNAREPNKESKRSVSPFVCHVWFSWRIAAAALPDSRSESLVLLSGRASTQTHDSPDSIAVPARSISLAGRFAPKNFADFAINQPSGRLAGYKGWKWGKNNGEIWL